MKSYKELKEFCESKEYSQFKDNKTPNKIRDDAQSLKANFMKADRETKDQIVSNFAKKHNIEPSTANLYLREPLKESEIKEENKDSLQEEKILYGKDTENSFDNLCRKYRFTKERYSLKSDNLFVYSVSDKWKEFSATLSGEVVSGKNIGKNISIDINYDIGKIKESHFKIITDSINDMKAFVGELETLR